MAINQRPNTKGSLKSISNENSPEELGQHEINFMFNPRRFSEKRGAKYNFSEAQGQIFPLAQYVQVENTALSFQLFNFDHKGLKTYLQNLRQLTLPKSFSELTYFEQVSPFKYMLTLGGIGSFIGVVSSCDINILQYDKITMDPIHLTADIEFICISSSIAQDVSRLKRLTGRK